MIRMLSVFVSVAVLIHLAITLFRNLNGLDRLTLVKTLVYSASVAAAAVLALMIIVFLF
jgi:hypothetical protein